MRRSPWSRESFSGSTENTSMKSFTRKLLPGGSHIRATTNSRSPIAMMRIAPVFAGVLFAALLLGLPFLARAEMSPREYEAHLIQKKRDFQKYLNERLQASESERDAALKMRMSREKEIREQNELQRRYREQMKRYSMEEIEARDRADERRIEQEQQQGESLRRDFIARRDRLRELDLAISPVDELKEFDIDMTKEPDFKSSYPSGEMQSLGSGGAD